MSTVEPSRRISHHSENLLWVYRDRRDRELQFDKTPDGLAKTPEDAERWAMLGDVYSVRTEPAVDCVWPGGRRFAALPIKFLPHVFTPQNAFDLPPNDWKSGELVLDECYFDPCDCVTFDEAVAEVASNNEAMMQLLADWDGHNADDIRQASDWQVVCELGRNLPGSLISWTTVNGLGLADASCSMPIRIVIPSEHAIASSGVRLNPSPHYRRRYQVVLTAPAADFEPSFWWQMCPEADDVEWTPGEELEPVEAFKRVRDFNLNPSRPRSYWMEFRLITPSEVTESSNMAASTESLERSLVS